MDSISQPISVRISIKMEKKLYTSLSIEGMADQLFDQTVNVVVYEQFMKEYFVSCSGGPSRNSRDCEKVTCQHLPYQYTTETQTNIKESVIKKFHKIATCSYFGL